MDSDSIGQTFFGAIITMGFAYGVHLLYKKYKKG